ncbi:hypothetical protein BGZ97_010838, partial [Linnemannia gamsii]
MIDKDLNLSCLVNGDYISKEFTLPMSSTETVGQLRKAIHLSKPIWFKDLEAEDLTLWRVFIPDNIQDSAITRDALDDKTELNRPKTLLSLVFPKPPDDNTYILVDRPPPDLVSEFDLVQCVPSAIRGEDQDEGPGVSSHSSISVTPLSVQSWADFLPSVNGMVLERVPQYQRPRFKEDRTFIPETTLQDLFSYDLGSTRILPPHATTIRIMGLPRGSPDLVCRKAGRNANVAGAILFPIEIKRPVLLQSPNLVEDYREQEQSG